MADRHVVGDTVRIGNTFTVDDVNTDPTTVTLVVTDPSGNTEGTFTYAGGTITKTATGVYHKDLSVDEDGVWEYKWTGSGTAADTATGTFTVWAVDTDDIDVLTLIEAKQAVGLEQTNTTADAALHTLVTAVSAQLDELCGPVRTRSFTETHDGGWYTIRLRHRPVYSITTVTEYDNTTSTTLTAETNSTKATSNYLHDGTAGKVASGIIRRRSNNSDATFPDGRRNVEVVYVAGRSAATEVVPAKFKQAASMMLRNVWTAEMASGTQTFDAFGEQAVNPLLGPGMLNKVAALLQGELLDGVYVG